MNLKNKTLLLFVQAYQKKIEVPYLEKSSDDDQKRNKSPYMEMSHDNDENMRIKKAKVSSS